MAEKKKALGRGLDALFEMQTPVPTKKEDNTNKKNDSISNDAGENLIKYIDINDIRPNEMQPRLDFDTTKITELASSIEKKGIISPVMLRASEYGYELVSGERRWRAAREAGLKEIPAIVKNNLSDEESAHLALIENIQREDLSAVEEAKAFKVLMDKEGLTHEGVAKAIGKSRSYVSNTLRIMDLPEPIIKYMEERKLTLGHANALGAVKNSKMQIKYADKIVNEGLSVRAAEALCSNTEGKIVKADTKKTVEKKSREVKEMENTLTSHLGAKVVINEGKKGGSIELHYADRAGLNDLIDLLREAKKKK